MVWVIIVIIILVLLMIDLKNHQTEEFDFPVMIFDIDLKSSRPRGDTPPFHYSFWGLKIGLKTVFLGNKGYFWRKFFEFRPVWGGGTPLSIIFFPSGQIPWLGFLNPFLRWQCCLVKVRFLTVFVSVICVFSECVFVRWAMIRWSLRAAQAAQRRWRVKLRAKDAAAASDGSLTLIWFV